MTRFDAAEPTDRRKLYVDAITAHRTRGSQFLTLEVDETALDGDTEPEFDGTDVADGSDDGPDPALGVPWIQFGDGTVNLDCTDDELEALKTVLEEFPAFKIDEVVRPDDAEGTNVRVSSRADPNRISQFIDAAFQQVYGLPATFRVWAVEV